MQDLIGFWSYALAACAFASVVLWRVRGRVDASDRLLLLACFTTAIWAMVAGVCGRNDPFTMTAGNVRNLAWIILIYEMAGGPRREAVIGMRLVFSAVALVIGLHFILSLLALIVPMTNAEFGDVLLTGSLLRITASAGALVLVHNVYGQAAPESRLRIRGPMLGLTLMWGYDLNLATLAYLQSPNAPAVIDLFKLRGIFMALTAPLFVWTAGTTGSLKIKLSRAATFQSLSLLGIGSYLAVMAILATAFRHSQLTWSSAATGATFVGLAIAAGTVLLSKHARAWVKVKIAKHLFEHRYDYRTEWLRFTDTLGRAGSDAAPLGERIAKAFADIVDAPGALLLVSDSGGAVSVAAGWNWPANPPADELHHARDFWRAIEASGRILELHALRQGWASSVDKAVPVPPSILNETRAWSVIPLLHYGRLIGIVVLSEPEYRQPLDWEDFDLLRTAGRQAASSLAESLSLEALADARRFEEFNRRFAFILHDVKNLVSQLSLLARNAERHADNAEFRADMVATLQGSVGKMNELLARLAPHSPSRVQRLAPESLRPVLTAAIAARRSDHDVRLLGDTSVRAVFDAAALEQAIGHLLQNAVESCSPAVPVTVRVDCAGDAVLITIADKGVGMDSDFVRNRLFQPFASSKPGGFGIGAFEARSLVTAMGGRLSVDSQPGRGTTFTITLPAAEAASEPQRKRA